MRFSAAIDEFISDQWSAGRIASENTVKAYRYALNILADEVKNRPPEKVGREDIKRTLARWPNPNTQSHRRSVYVAFFSWSMEEGIRKDNPALQTRKPKHRKPIVYRLTREEAAAMLNVARPGRERRIIALQLGAGLRVSELTHLQGRHFKRPGWIWVSADIAKGGRERWIPVIEDTADVVAEIVEYVEPTAYVVPLRMNGNWGLERKSVEDPFRPTSRTTIARAVKDVGQRAGIVADISCHTLRHAFGDHVARGTGLLVAQALMGHASVETTRSTYVGEITLDELAISLRGFSYAKPSPAGNPAQTGGPTPHGTSDAR
jgi:integrase/recombinase XerD